MTMYNPTFSSSSNFALHDRLWDRSSSLHICRIRRFDQLHDCLDRGLQTLVNLRIDAFCHHLASQAVPHSGMHVFCRSAVNCLTSRPSIVILKQVAAIRLSLNFNGSVYSTMELGSVYSTIELSDSIEHFISQDAAAAAAAGLFKLMELDAGRFNVRSFVAVVVVDDASSRDCKT